MSLLKELQKCKKLGCEDQTKCAVACRVCIDLKETKHFKKVVKVFDADLDVIYLRVKPKKGARIYVPALSCQDMDLLLLEKLQTKFGGEEKSVYLALADPASNVLYYKVTGDIELNKAAHKRETKAKNINLQTKHADKVEEALTG